MGLTVAGAREEGKSRMANWKRIAYLSLETLRRTAWAAVGGRRVFAMGESLRLAPETVFPTYRNLRLPRGRCRSKIVRYCDFVQMHACCAYCETLKQPFTVVDVGAHHGAYAVLLGKMAQRHGGRVIAVEPNPTSCKTLARNIRMNKLEGTVVIEPMAVWEESEVLPLALKESESQLSLCGEGESVTVKAGPLSGILRRHQVERVDLLIIDVEGAELPVLRTYPWSEIPLGRVFCELHPSEWSLFGYGPSEIASFLQEHRLRCLDAYFTEHLSQSDQGYIGPCILLPNRD